jgi:tetratricopeptide (TPR) repeat protein
MRARELSAVSEALSHAESSPFLQPECLQLRAALALALHVGYDQIDPLTFLREAIAAAPANWSIRKRHLEYLIERGDLGPASSELGAFLEKYPFRAESWALLGQIQDRAGDKQRATIAYQEATRRDVRDEKTRARLRALGEDAGNR